MTASQVGRLLAACIRHSLGFGSSRDVCDAAADVRDWVGFAEIAESHGLQPLVAHCFGVTGVRPPSQILDALEASLSRNAKRVMVLSEELNRIYRRLDAAGVPALAVKGPVSAWSLYDDPACRVFHDLDLLVPPGSVREAREVLSRCGYEAWGPAGFSAARELYLPHYSELCLENSANGAKVDLHWELTPRKWFAALPSGVWDRKRLVRIGEHEIRTLGEEDTFLHLCLHGAKHGWSHLGWLVDLCGVIARSPDIATRSLRLAAPESKAAAMVEFAMACALELAPDLRLEPAVGIPDRTRARARAFVHRNLSGSASEGSAFSRFRFQWSLGGNGRPVLRYVSHWLLTPDHEDWASLPLRQRKLLFLLKPWRLFRLGFRLLPSRSAKY